MAPYAVDNHFFQQAADELLPKRVSLRREYGLPDDAPVFLFCGKLIDVKRPLDVVEAFARIPRENDAFLLFVGDGVLRSRVEARVRSLGLRKVRLLGFRNQREISRFYALSDVLVLPSEFEPWGLVLNEAMNFGLAVVASNQVGGAVDLVRAGSTGEVFPVGNIEALVMAMEQCMKEPRRSLAGRASRRAIESWSIEAAAAGIAAAVHACARAS
jgi:glycosyltransferase involved in cell wall biosynthesis